MYSVKQNQSLFFQKVDFSKIKNSLHLLTYSVASACSLPFCPAEMRFWNCGNNFQIVSQRSASSGAASSATSSAASRAASSAANRAASSAASHLDLEEARDAVGDLLSPLSASERIVLLALVFFFHATRVRTISFLFDARRSKVSSEVSTELSSKVSSP